jgi:23S rRNA (guanosine2251-2'-O)-methyltransferase
VAYKYYKLTLIKSQRPKGEKVKPNFCILIFGVYNGGMPKIAIIVHNVRSTHNVGAVLRSADGFGVNEVYLTGYTPYPEAKNDNRLPHLRSKLSKQIQKTALGAEKTVAWKHETEIQKVITSLKAESYLIAALEQTTNAKNLSGFTVKQNIALIVGNEVDGIDAGVLKLADVHLEIPMAGSKESLNVAVAASVAMYHLTLIEG